jgi:hypothetical protein
LLLSIALASLAASCSTSNETAAPAAPTIARVKTSPDGGLKVSTRKTTIDGQRLRILGSVVNRYDKPVDGVRYVVEMVIPGAPPRIIDTAQQENTDLKLEPGQVHRIRIELERPVYSSTTGMFSVEAAPIKLDGKPMPPPAGWK